MLDSETKRRIDGLRDILVGKTPSPQSQVEQIMTGLMFKFMHDLDCESIKMGGEASFFVGDYKKYGWQHFLDQKLSGAKKVQLYSEAIEAMYTHPTAQPLYREVFKNAFLPFRDPQTLSMFLKGIDKFRYSHSEELGNAFEYLLSFMGAQGDAGQFRTPRHIADFIVAVVDPQKDETILDPACGTAGFLISAYKHILAQNSTNQSGADSKPDADNKPEAKSRPGDKLSAKERRQLGKNLSGYDISPDMVRISLMNMFLHQFADPKIYEYDTLSSEERWSEYYDVILANPPFFSPKGGIKPHNRFAVQSTRAEVLFVSYIMAHLTPNGRAGVVVPEGIIFQTGTAYKTLRKSLVEDCLVGVISLPAGVFQPYSGVKTSVLILDKKQKRESIFFAKVENDGFSLGAQRTPIKQNDLPKILKQIQLFFSNQKTDLITVAKGDIENASYNLSMGIYEFQKEILNTEYPISTVKDVCDVTTGRKDVNSGNPNGIYPFFTCAKEHTFSDEFSFDTEALLIAGNGDVGRVSYYKGKFEAYQRTYVLDNFSKILPRYLFFILQAKLPIELNKLKQGNTMPYIKVGMLKNFEIPLPPIETQKQIVDELEGYQSEIENKKTEILHLQQKIQNKINKIWGK